MGVADGPVKRGKGCLGFLVVVALIVVGLDFGARWFAQDYVATALQQRLQTSKKPSVDIAGWPFAMHLLTQRVEEASVRADGIALRDGMTAGLTLNLKDVSKAPTAVRVEGATGVVTLDVRPMLTARGIKVDYLPPDAATANLPMNVLGKQVQVDATISPRFDAETGTLRFEARRLAFGSTEVPRDTAQSLVEKYLPPLKVPLPLGAKARAVSVSSAGLVLNVETGAVELPTGN